MWKYVEDVVILAEFEYSLCKYDFNTRNIYKTTFYGEFEVKGKIFNGNWYLRIVFEYRNIMYI